MSADKAVKFTSPEISKALKNDLFNNPLKIAPHLQYLAVPIDSLKLDPDNVNEHTAENLATIRASFDRVGQLKPVVCLDNGTIKAGNGAWMVAKEMGATLLAAVPIPADVSQYADEFALADNQSGRLSHFQPDRLKAMIEKLRARGIKSKDLGFSDKLLADLLAKAKKPKVPSNWGDAESKSPRRSEVGDLWLMGRHRLLVGDSRDPQVLKRLMGDRKAQCVFTDPPYNVDYEDDKGRKIKNDDLSVIEHVDLLTEVFQNSVDCATPDAAFYIWHASGTRANFVDAMKAAGLVERQYLIWNKNNFALGRSHYHWKHEPCFYASAQKTQPKWYGDRTQSTVWDFVIEGAERVHPNQKPIELAMRAMYNSTQVTQVVLDPFCGSGSTLGAAEVTNRVAYLVDLEPRWADTVIARWEKMTKQKAVKDGDE